MKRFLLTWCLATLGASTLGVVAGCNRKSASPDSAKAKEEAPRFTTVKPERKTLQRTIERPAHVDAYEETPIVVRIAGYVGKIDCDIGTPVKGPRYDSQGNVISPGQVLAELSVPEMEVELKEKEALAMQADAEMKLAQESLKGAEAEKNRLKSQFERLAKSTLLSPDQIEETRLSYEVSEARLGMAKAEVAVKKARLEVAKQNHAYIKTMLEYAALRAPFDGVVTRRNVHPGWYVQPGTSAPPLFVVTRSDKVRVTSEIPESEAAYIQDKMKAKVRVQMLKDREFTGEVTRTSWSLDPKALTLRIEIELLSQGVLVPGTYAFVSLHGKFADRLTVPAPVIVRKDDETYCFLLEDGKARKTLVQLGLRSGNLVEVLRKQITAESATRWENFTGEETLLSGNLGNLSDGQKVQ